jgi:hypothetical protein
VAITCSIIQVGSGYRLARPYRTSTAARLAGTTGPAYTLVPNIARTALDVLLDHMPDIRPEPGRRTAGNSERRDREP